MSKASLDVWIESQRSSEQFGNDPDGWKALIDRLAEVGAAAGIVVAFEATCGYEGGHSDIWYGPIRLGSVDDRGRLTRYRPDPAAAKKPVDLMESESALPTTPQAQQPQPKT